VVSVAARAIVVIAVPICAAVAAVGYVVSETTEVIESDVAPK